MQLERIAVSPDGTHHWFGGRAFYEARFAQVLNFHPPGLAAVADDSGHYHITLEGRPAYQCRFTGAFGFYERRAAVFDQTGWFHILENGVAVYSERFGWCGNYQQDRVPIRDRAGRYFHLDSSGRRAYSQTFLYAGDYRDGVACVRDADGLCIHIDLLGRQIHSGRYLDLDVLHKGFARARDAHGWFHIRTDGLPAYEARFAEIEPFYNGQAHARTLAGTHVVVGETGSIVHEVWKSSSRELRANRVFPVQGGP
jgi:hypothetical protein